MSAKERKSILTLPSPTSYRSTSFHIFKLGVNRNFQKQQKHFWFEVFRIVVNLKKNFLSASVALKDEEERGRNASTNNKFTIRIGILKKKAEQFSKKRLKNVGNGIQFLGTPSDPQRGWEDGGRGESDPTQIDANICTINF